MRAQLELLRDSQFGVFTAAQAELEYTRQEIRTRIRLGKWVRVFRGVYREDGTPPTPALCVEAARLSMGLPTIVAGYDTAAELHGFSVAEGAATHVFGVQRRRSEQLVVHEDRLDSATVELVDETLCTNAVRTAVDVARTANRMDALATLDAAVGQGLSAEALIAEIERHHRRRGFSQATEMIGLADSRAESPMESYTRLRCIDAGLPHPEPQLEVSTPDGYRRLDLGWRQWRIGLEYESVAWHSGLHAAARDNARHNALTTQGWTIFYATASDVLSHPHRFTEPIRSAIDRAASRGPSKHPGPLLRPH
ncbi:type IV toxin-antitoxin system AbiEi family antitoxin domain-containing protein [Nocardia altamirensis]|uniref:type IV toxin-antitoxin system AbiEi family antitoxin domain-containing protein n=1 Tax=Nocardia altamirensis TaxID=472158 RepID=UPI00350E47DB